MDHNEQVNIQSICGYIEHIRKMFSDKSKSFNSTWCKLQPLATQECWKVESDTKDELDDVFIDIFNHMFEVQREFTILQDMINEYHTNIKFGEDEDTK